MEEGNIASGCQNTSSPTELSLLIQFANPQPRCRQYCPSVVSERAFYIASLHWNIFLWLFMMKRLKENAFIIDHHTVSVSLPSNLLTSSLVSPSLVHSQPFSDSAARCLSAYTARQQMSAAPAVCTTHYVQIVLWQLMVLFIASILPSPVTLSRFSSVFPPLHPLCFCFSFSLSLLRWLAVECFTMATKWINSLNQCLSTSKFLSLTTTLNKSILSQQSNNGFLSF